MRATSPRATRRDAQPRLHAATSPPSAPRKRADDGLSLVEMVVAVGIVMVVLTSALSVFVLAKKAQQTAEGTDQASQLAYEQIERIRQLDWTDIGFQPAVMTTISGSVARAQDSTTGPEYRGESPYNDGAGGATMASGESQVLFLTNALGDDEIKPYQTVTVSNNKFRVYTSISYGGDPALGLPATSATTSPWQYSFKRVTVTVYWKASGNGSAYRVSAESWFAPEAEDAVPPGVPCLIEETRAAC
jgi:type II secretory pathway pseudopilin PulG